MRYVNINAILLSALVTCVLGAAYLFAPLLTNASVNYQMSLHPAPQHQVEIKPDVLREFQYAAKEEYTEQFLIFDLLVDPESRTYDELPESWYNTKHNWM